MIFYFKSFPGKIFRKCKENLLWPMFGSFWTYLGKAKFSSKFCSYQFFELWLSIIVLSLKKRLISVFQATLVSDGYRKRRSHARTDKHEFRLKPGFQRKNLRDSYYNFLSQRVATRNAMHFNKCDNFENSTLERVLEVKGLVYQIDFRVFLRSSFGKDSYKFKKTKPKFSRSYLVSMLIKKNFIVNISKEIFRITIVTFRSNHLGMFFENGVQDGGPYHLETSPLIFRANQWTCFCRIGTSIGTSVIKVLNSKEHFLKISKIELWVLSLFLIKLQAFNS